MSLYAINKTNRKPLKKTFLSLFSVKNLKEIFGHFSVLKNEFLRVSIFLKPKVPDDEKN